MTLRIFATGDHHFQDDSPRWDETLRVHEHIAALVERERPDALLSGGDWLERASRPKERKAIRDFARAVTRWCPLVSSRGNHDPPGDLASFLTKLRTDHALHLVEDARVVPLALGGHAITVDVAIAAVSWPAAASAIDDGVARTQLRELLTDLGSQMAAAPRRILLGHFDTDGAKSGAGQPIIGGSLRVALADLGAAKAHAVVMAHIHKAQAWTHDGCPILYTGSPVAHDFGETDEKSIVDMRWDEAAQAFVYERIPTTARRMLLLTGRYDETTAELYVNAAESPGPHESIVDAEVRLHYTVRPEHRETARKAAEQMADAWRDAGAVRVLVEDEAISTVRAREGALEVAAAPTLAEQLQALWVARGDVPAPEVAARLLGKVAGLAA